MHKLKKSQIQKLFLKSKTILRAAFFYIKIYKIPVQELATKNIIVIPKKCGKAVRRNYLRRVTKALLIKYALNTLPINFIFIYSKENLNHIVYNTIEESFIHLTKKIQDATL